MIYSNSGPLPYHLDIYADSAFFARKPFGFWPVRWFGLVSKYGLAWGCNVMLESGAIYRNLPPHALAFKPNPDDWTIQQAQRWDCYGPQFSVLVYPALDGLDCQTVDGHEGVYLFTVAPMNDAFSRDPRQSKEFTFVRLNNGRLTIQPTDKVVFRDKSFTTSTEWPKGLKRQTEEWRCE
jgi:hypothetical protein